MGRKMHCSNLYILFTFFFIIVLNGSALWHLQRFLQGVKYIILEFTPSTAFLYPSPIPGTVSTGIIFALYVYKLFALYSFS
jgi:hypothetical protein